MFKSKYTYIVLAAAMLMMFASVFMTQQDISYCAYRVNTARHKM